MSPEVFGGEKYDPTLADGQIHYRHTLLFLIELFCTVLAVYSIGVIAYIVLTGKRPYKSPHMMDPGFNYIFTGRLEALLKHYGFLQRLHPLAVNFLKCTLCAEKERWTISQLLAHPWLSSAIQEQAEQQSKHSLTLGLSSLKLSDPSSSSNQQQQPAKTVPMSPADDKMQGGQQTFSFQTQVQQQMGHMDTSDANPETQEEMQQSR
jgi:serine/threonine protein kinase